MSLLATCYFSRSVFSTLCSSSFNSVQCPYRASFLQCFAPPNVSLTVLWNRFGFIFCFCFLSFGLSFPFQCFVYSSHPEVNIYRLLHLLMSRLFMFHMPRFFLPYLQDVLVCFLISAVYFWIALQSRVSLLPLLARSMDGFSVFIPLSFLIRVCKLSSVFLSFVSSLAFSAGLSFFAFSRLGWCAFFT